MNKEKIEQLLQLLQSPDDSSALRFHAKENEVRSEREIKSYSVESFIPQLLPLKTTAPESQSQVHNDANSNFEYVDHYVKDADYYDYFEAHEDGPSRHENRRLHETILNEIPEGIKNILDAGCGNGWIAKAMRGRDVEVVSMDISLKNVKTTLEKYPFEKHYGLVADLFALPIREGVFDCIICAEVIEHVVDPGLLMRNLVKRLSPNGVLILTTPHDEKIVYHMCVHCNRPTPENAHLHSFTKTKLMDMVAISVEEAADYKTHTFSNKYLTRLRTHVILQFFPYRFWKAVDDLANRIMSKPVRLLLKVQKHS